jgi:cytochrome c
MRCFSLIMLLGARMKSPIHFVSSAVLLLALIGAASVPLAVADEVLAERAGCSGCHGVAGQGTGPTYEAIALRYKGETGARELLSEKLAAGGAGNWTDETGGLSMPPYSNLLSSEEIRALVDWILAQEAREVQ